MVHPGGHARGHLVPLLEPLVGRAEELERLAACLVDQALIVLCGAVGVGKSTLAVALATRWQQAGASASRGVWWCNVSTCEGSDELDERVRDLDVRGGLLVLDGADGVVEHLEPWVRRFFAERRERRLVITSRTRFSMVGAEVIEVKPLPPEAAYELFVRRAGLARSGMSLSRSERAAVAEIVARVDGLPLAVELCAAQSLVLRPIELLEHLRSCDALLDVSAQGTTLRNVIAAAVGLLPTAAQAAWRACALFEEDFSFSCFSEVAASDLATLHLLCERSLVHVDDEVSPGPGAARRVFRLYRPLREFARAAGIDETAHERHRSWCLSRAASADMRSNLLASAKRDELAGRSERAFETLMVAVPQVVNRGPVGRCLMQLDAVWPADVGDAALLARAQLCFVHGELRRADADLARIAIRGSFGLRAVLERANVARAAGRLADATTKYEQALGLATVPGERALVLERLAGHLFEQGERELAEERFRESASAFAAVGDMEGAARVRHSLGVVAQDTGDLVSAEACFRDAIEQHRSLGSERFRAIAEFDLAALHLEAGAVVKAVSLLEQVAPELEAIGDRRQASLAAALLGVCAHAQGRLSLAREHLDGARAIAEELDDRAVRVAVAIHRCQVFPHEPLPEGPHRSDEERYAHRLLVKLRAEAKRCVVVTRGARHVAVADGERVELKSKAARLILLALVAAHDSPDVAALDRASLVRAGWPGQRLLDSAAMNRLQVALSALRKAGLAEVLVRGEAGYALSPNWLVRFEGDA